MKLGKKTNAYVNTWDPILVCHRYKVIRCDFFPYYDAVGYIYVDGHESKFPFRCAFGQ